MKKYLIAYAIILILAISPGQSQTSGSFRVVRVVGTVESTKLNHALTTQDVIPDGDQLKFRAPSDYIIVFHPKQGRKRIMGVPDNQPREISQLLQSFVKPDEKSTGTRGSNPAYIDELKTSLQDSVLILGNGVVDVDPTQLSLRSPGSIRAQYKTKENKTVVITVSSGQTIRLDKKTLFPNSAVPSSRILVMYFLTESINPLESEEFLGNFSPVYVDDSILIPEVKSIATALQGSSAADIEREVYIYLSQEYGKPISSQLHTWLKSNQVLPMP